jgi:hypothetical protein
LLSDILAVRWTPDYSNIFFNEYLSYYYVTHLILKEALKL